MVKDTKILLSIKSKDKETIKNASYVEEKTMSEFIRDAALNKAKRVLSKEIQK